MSEVLYLKLTNGEDIIATVIGEDDDSIHITFPLKFIYGHNPKSNSMSTGIVRWVPMEDIMNSVFQIQKYNVVAAIDVPERMEVFYNGMLEQSQTAAERDTMEKSEDMFNEISDNPALMNLLMANTESKMIH